MHMMTVDFLVNNNMLYLFYLFFIHAFQRWKVMKYKYLRFLRYLYFTWVFFCFFLTTLYFYPLHLCTKYLYFLPLTLEKTAEMVGTCVRLEGRWCCEVCNCTTVNPQAVCRHQVVRLLPTFLCWSKVKFTSAGKRLKWFLKNFQISWIVIPHSYNQ